MKRRDCVGQQKKILSIVRPLRHRQHLHPGLRQIPAESDIFGLSSRNECPALQKRDRNIAGTAIRATALHTHMCNCES